MYHLRQMHLLGVLCFRACRGYPSEPAETDVNPEADVGCAGGSGTRESTWRRTTSASGCTSST